MRQRAVSEERSECWDGFILLITTQEQDTERQSSTGSHSACNNAFTNHRAGSQCNYHHHACQLIWAATKMISIAHKVLKD